MKNYSIKRIISIKVMIVLLLVFISVSIKFKINVDLLNFMDKDYKFVEIFKYPSFMRLIYIPIYLLIKYTGCKNMFLASIIFIIPILTADIVIFILMEKLFKGKNKELTLFYVLSPIVLYTSYLRFDLDIIALAILFSAIYFLIKDRGNISAVLLGISMATKTPVFLSMPIILMYIYKINRYNKFKKVFKYILVFFTIYLCISLPFIFNKEYQELVLKANSLELMLQTFYKIGHLEIYLAPAAIMFVYIRFSAYKKVNKQLLFDFLGLVYSIFVLLIPPLHNWYLWTGIFMSVLYINKFKSNKNIKYIYILMSGIYIIYFSKLYKYIILTEIDKNLTSGILKNLIFTLLEVVLLVSCYTLYKFGIRSNKIYKSDNVSVIIGVGGDSGAGKTTLIKAIESLLGKSRIVSIEADGDHKWERGDENWKQFTHLNPKANYLYRQANYLRELKLGDTIQRVEYDHSTGTFTNPIEVKSNDYILVAGLHPFYLPQTRKIMDIKIYLDTDEKLRRHWKIIRDTKKRGYSTAKIAEQIESRIKDAPKYIYPQKQFSDFIIRYFTDEEFELGNENYNPKIKLSIKVNAEIDLDDIINDLYRDEIYVIHEFDEDLKYQTIILDRPIDNKIIKRIVDNRVENIEQIIDENKLVWQDGYLSFIQMILLMAIVDIMKGTENYEL